MWGGQLDTRAAQFKDRQALGSVYFVLGSAHLLVCPSFFFYTTVLKMYFLSFKMLIRPKYFYFIASVVKFTNF